MGSFGKNTVDGKGTNWASFWANNQMASPFCAFFDDGIKEKGLQHGFLTVADWCKDRLWQVLFAIGSLAKSTPSTGSSLTKPRPMKMDLLFGKAMGLLGKGPLLFDVSSGSKLSWSGLMLWPVFGKGFAPLFMVFNNMFLFRLCIHLILMKTLTSLLPQLYFQRPSLFLRRRQGEWLQHLFVSEGLKDPTLVGPSNPSFALASSVLFM